MPKQIVRRDVADEEVLVRGLVDPLFWSERRSKFKKEAFMPPPESNDVSVLRLCYTDDHFCKRHSASLQIPNNKYVGLAVVLPKHIRRVNGTIPNNPVSIDAVCTPLDENKAIIDNNIKVYKDDKGWPMHADILYSEPNVKEEVEEIGNPREKIGQISMEISKYAVGENDPHPGTDDWRGTPLCDLLKKLSR